MQAEAASPPARPVMEDPVPTPSRVRFGKGRKGDKKGKWDRQPSQPSAVLIATVGIPIPPEVIRQAVKLSGGRPVAVVSIARIYGSSFGLPNPVQASQPAAAAKSPLLPDVMSRNAFGFW